MESDASSDILEQLKDITECCICSETLRDSRVLPCIHTFCLDCLRRTHSSFANAGNKLPCPICRSEFVVPSEGMDKLPRNFFIERVIEMTKTTTPGTAQQREGRPTLCDACLDDNGEPGTNDIPPATMQCVECRQNLCDECCKHHRKNKMTRTHRIVALGEKVDEPAESTESEHRVNPGVCETHQGKPLEIYCSTCQTVTCVKCYFEAHQSHKCSEVAIVVDDLKKQVLTDIRKVSSWASEAKEKLKQLGTRKKEFMSNADALDAAISSRKEELKKLVETQAMLLLAHLQTIKQRTIKEIENDKDSIERHIAILDSYTLYCNAVNTNGTASDICLGASELHARAEKLLQLHESFDFNHSRVEKVKLKTDEPDECLKSCKNIVGKLHVSYKSKQDNECNIQIPEEHATNNGSKAESTSDTKHSDASNSFSIRLLHRVTSHDQWAMSGITHLGDSIYILSSSSNSILVHQDKEPFQKLRDIQTKSIKSPVDISSCQTSNCLYITDQKSSSLWKISPSQNDEINKCLSDIGEPYTLSVSSDRCVLMAKSGSPCSYLTSYNPVTDAVRSIELPVEVEDPQHAVKTSTGNFIVSYGKKTKDQKSWNLMEVTDSGQIVRLHEARNTFQQLNGSYHLAVDANDRVIVVDFYNNRVMLLDSKLNWARTLLTKDRHGILSPKRLCFVKHNNQLIVKNRKTVDVYSFQSSSQLHNG